jgi:hypothetical protein
MHFVSAAVAILNGHYHDGYVPSGGAAFIVADQIWLLMVVIVHTWSTSKYHKRSYADKFVWRATTKEERKEGQPDYILVPTERVYYTPDVTAAIYWTTNRMPHKRRDVHKHQVTRMKTPDDWLVDIRNDILDRIYGERYWYGRQSQPHHLGR